MVKLFVNIKMEYYYVNLASFSFVNLVNVVFDVGVGRK